MVENIVDKGWLPPFSSFKKKKVFKWLFHQGKGWVVVETSEVLSLSCKKGASRGLVKDNPNNEGLHSMIIIAAKS